jgi:hypothetical protein
VALALAGAVRAWSLRLAVLLSLVVAPGTAWASRGDASAAALKLAEHQVTELPELLSALDQVAGLAGQVFTSAMTSALPPGAPARPE